MKQCATLATFVVAALLTTAGTHAAPEPSRSSRVRGAMLGALVADALCLGTHYEYSAEKIQQYYGAIDRFYAPGEKTDGQTHGVGWGARNYHNGNGNGAPKTAGEQTDNGDYNLLFLEHLASGEPLLDVWQRRLASWRSWICTQTKIAWQQVRSGVRDLEQLGGNSNAMNMRSAGALAFVDSEEEMVQATRDAMFTHRERTAHLGGEFFARVAWRVAHKGLEPRAAIEQVASESHRWIQEKVQQALDKVAEAADASSDLAKEAFVDDRALTSMARLWDVGKSEPIRVGKASPTEGVLPGAVYLIVKYNDFAKAAQSNAEIGGDNASRSIMIGMVLGAHQGVEGIPQQWLDALVEREQAESWLSKGAWVTKNKEEL